MTAASPLLSAVPWPPITSRNQGERIMAKRRLLRTQWSASPAISKVSKMSSVGPGSFFRAS